MCTTAGAIFSTTSAMKLNLYLGLLGCVGPILAERITHVNNPTIWSETSTTFSFVMLLLSFYSPKKPVLAQEGMISRHECLNSVLQIQMVC